MTCPTFQWEQVGGRCRLVEPGDVVSLTSEQIQEAMHQKEVKKRQMEMEELKRLRETWRRERKKRKRGQEEMLDMMKFLELHKFTGVNTPRYSCFGFKRTYPLHVAIQEGNFRIYKLLLKFGADSELKDHCGRVAYSV
ncbi:unnamed protein product [Durusdinium trenchii]|uniref:Uncharacterized protein n=1 Tax=Durusdinium trenchii TaxID=1381693 RepID=A0ABP0HNV1_9DINO